MKKFFVLLLLVTTTNFAEIRFVSKTGTCTPPYTSWETAADSIQKCINICNDGDTVVVANGVYKETLLIETELTLLGSSMDSCIIDGSGLDGVPLYGNTGITIRAEKFIAIKNFHVKGRRYEPLTVVFYARKNGAVCKNLRIENAYSGIGVSKGNSKIDECIVINTSSSLDTSSPNNLDTIYITNNYIINNKESGKGLNNGGGGIHYIFNNILLALHPSTHNGVDLSLDRYSEVKNNLIANYSSANYNGGIFLEKAIIENNVFLQYRGSWSNNDNISVLKGSGTIIRNNIIASAKRYGINSQNDTTFADYNLFWNNGVNTNSLVKLGENNIYDNPMFVNDTIPTPSSNYDFHLQAFSPAINAGDTTILDKDGSRSDIGMYGGMLGEVYSYLDLPPRVPGNISYIQGVDSLQILFNWNMNSEADFRNYNIYRDTISGFTISPDNKFFESDTSFFIENYSTTSKKYNYKITAVDSQANESNPSAEIYVLLTGVEEPTVNIVQKYFLYQNYPNPFNPVTKIGYSLQEPGYVRLVVYDIKGELIRILIDELKQTSYHETEFRADNLSSGIYLYKIEIRGEDKIPKYSELKKLIHLK